MLHAVSNQTNILECCFLLVMSCSELFAKAYKTMLSDKSNDSYKIGFPYSTGGVSRILSRSLTYVYDTTL